MSVQRHQLRIACPTCGKKVVRAPDRPAPFLPFCSERCKLVDLGKWFDGAHRIAGPPAEDRNGPKDGEDDG